MGTYLQRYQQDDRNVLSASEVLIVIKAILQLQTTALSDKTTVT